MAIASRRALRVVEDVRVSDERAPGARRRDGTVFDRIFPGPAARDPDLAARLEAIRKAAEQRAETRRSAGGRQRSGTPGSPPAMTADDVTRVTDALHDQTEVIRALLEADIAIRDDARATAQNSRTFAIAGTVIAFVTLVATVVLVVTAFTQAG